MRLHKRHGASKKAAYRSSIGKAEAYPDLGKDIHGSPLHDSDPATVLFDKAGLKQSERERCSGDARGSILRVARRFRELSRLETSFALMFDGIWVKAGGPYSLAARLDLRGGRHQLIELTNALHWDERLHTRRDGVLHRQIKQIAARYLERRQNILLLGTRQIDDLADRLADLDGWLT